LLARGKFSHGCSLEHYSKFEYSQVASNPSRFSPLDSVFFRGTKKIRDFPGVPCANQRREIETRHDPRSLSS
jgi:hypothetical protein